MNDFPNLYSYVVSNPAMYSDPTGLSVLREIGKWLAGPGMVCVKRGCNPISCDDVKSKPEADGEALRCLPKPPKRYKYNCENTDIIYTRKGWLKIPNGCRAFISCDTKGHPNKNVEVKCGRISPDPEFGAPGTPTPPGLPSNPFDPPDIEG